MIIGVVGLIGSGKGTVGDYLRDKHGFKQRAFAAPVKDVASTVFGWDREMLEGNTPESRDWREQPDPQFDGIFPDLNEGKLTPRLALQKIGTECFRDVFGINIWVSSLLLKIETGENTVITDVRFQNEIAAIEANGGKLWWVRGESIPSWLNGLIEHQLQPKHIHSSEWEWAKEGVGNFAQIINAKDGIVNFHKVIEREYENL
jgi:hypothetical protein